MELELEDKIEQRIKKVLTEQGLNKDLFKKIFEVKFKNGKYILKTSWSGLIVDEEVLQEFNKYQTAVEILNQSIGK